MRIRRYPLHSDQVPIDFLADPDGCWEYENLVAWAGFDPESEPAPVVGALSEGWRGHPAGAAVVAASTDGGTGVTVVECDHPALDQAVAA